MLVKKTKAQARTKIWHWKHTIEEDKPARQKAHAGFVGLKDKRVNVQALRYFAFDWRAKTSKGKHSADGRSPTTSITGILHDTTGKQKE